MIQSIVADADAKDVMPFWDLLPMSISLQLVQDYGFFKENASDVFASQNLTYNGTLGWDVALPVTEQPEDELLSLNLTDIPDMLNMSNATNITEAHIRAALLLLNGTEEQ